jgi:hypothetical protein
MTELSDHPMEWAETASAFEGTFKSRWLPGAFGERADIAGVHHFRVLEEEWEEQGDDPPLRTIKRAIALD